MQPKSRCDVCNKEIQDFGARLFGSKYLLFSLLDNSIDAEFCSIKCLKEFVGRLE